MTFMWTFRFTRENWSVTFRMGHRSNTVAIMPKFYRPSVYTAPYLSVRFLCFWFTHDWNQLAFPEVA